MRRRRPVGHEDALPVVDHLDELRSRLVVSIAALVAAVGLCFWKNGLVLSILSAPLDGKELVTLSPTEPFLTTLKVCTYAAIVLALPVILYQVYAFIVPAFGPGERRVAIPLLLLIPVLFIAGAVFAYLVVVPAALSFLLDFNADQFNTELRAAEYYGFMTTTLLAVGAMFQLPVGILALTRLGVVTTDVLRKNRRYAYLACVAAAAALPGVDPVTMMFEAVPLVILYELSILLARAFGGSPAPVEPAPGPRPASP